MFYTSKNCQLTFIEVQKFTKAKFTLKIFIIRTFLGVNNALGVWVWRIERLKPCIEAANPKLKKTLLL